MNSKLSDEELMFQFQKGNEQAFNNLVHRYKNKLLNHIFYFVKDLERAEDVLQDVFIRLYKHGHKYNDSSKVSTWLYTIATNQAKTELSRFKRHDHISITGKNEEKEIEIPDMHTSTDGAVLKKELKEVIMHAIENLSDKLKEVIVMCDIDQLSYDEIAEILNIPVGTVKSRINRARLALQEMIKKYI